MRRAAVAATVLVAACTAVPAWAQVRLSGGSHTRGRAALRFTPFADLERGRWGFSSMTQVAASTTALGLRDALALKVLVDNDSLLYSDAINALALVSPGDNLEIAAGGASRVFVGGPLGARLAVGFTGGVRAFSSTVIDSNLISLLRDGTAAHPDISLGATRAAGVLVAEAGAHATYRLRGGPRYTGGVTIGVGARVLRPAWYGRAATDLNSRLAVSADSVIADVSIEALRSAEVLQAGADRVAVDLFLGWESSHHALEVAVGQGVTLQVPLVERRTTVFRVRTATLQEVADSVDAATFAVQDTGVAPVRLPAMLRARAILFWDKMLSAELGVAVADGGPFEHPPVYDAGLTLRLIPLIPVTAGFQAGPGSLPVYYARTGIVTTHFQLEIGGLVLGALGEQARGAGGNVRIGLFF